MSCGILCSSSSRSRTDVTSRPSAKSVDSASMAETGGAGVSGTIVTITTENTEDTGIVSGDLVVSFLRTTPSDVEGPTVHVGSTIDSIIDLVHGPDAAARLL